MGSCLQDYRAAIGLFDGKCRKNLKRSFDYRADTYQDILLTNLRCTFLIASLSLLQSLNPNVNTIFLLFVLQTILIIGNVEMNPGPQSPNQLNSSSYRTESCISMCNMNIRSIRNKLDFCENFTDEFDIVTVTETHLSPSINNNELVLESFSPNIFRKDRNNSGGGILIYTKDDIAVFRKEQLENHVDESSPR